MTTTPVVFTRTQFNTIPTTPSCVGVANTESCPTTIPNGLSCASNNWVWGCAANGNCNNTIYGSTYYCSAIDPNICPKFGQNNTGPYSVTLADPNQSDNIVPSGSGVGVVCQYDPSIFTNMTPDQAKVFFSEALTDYPGFDIAARNYCLRNVTTNCPEDVTTGGQMPSCAQLSTLDDQGVECRNWFYGLTGDIQTEYFGSYCLSGKTGGTGITTMGNVSHDCDCLYPQPYMLYSELNGIQGFAGAPECWWLPCKTQNGAYFIPPEYRGGTCSSNNVICTNIVEFIDATVNGGGQINVNEVDNYTGCGFGQNGFVNFLESYWWVILLIIGIIIVIILFYYFWRSRRQVAI